MILMMMRLGSEKLEELVWHIFTTQPDEIDCDTCFAQLDLFAEITLAGGNAAQALPQVHAHLQRCGACHEEFEALLSALGSFYTTL